VVQPLGVLQLAVEAGREGGGGETNWFSLAFILKIISIKVILKLEYLF